jgi:hypothetical protein
MNATESAALEKPVELQVPRSVLVRCPLVQFRLRAIADHCPACPHFRGLSDRFPGPSSLAFIQRYTVLCAAEPVRRELFEIEMPESREPRAESGGT